MFDLSYLLGGDVSENVGGIADHVDCRKGDYSFDKFKRLGEHGPQEFRLDYRIVATDFERELLLDEIREKAKQGGRAGREWSKIASSLDRIFRKKLVADGGYRA